jgi:hypothetical protein
MRVYPQMQNTGGFFIAVLQKAGGAPAPIEAAAEVEMEPASVLESVLSSFQRPPLTLLVKNTYHWHG